MAQKTKKVIKKQSIVKIKRTSSIKDVIADSKDFLKAKPVTKCILKERVKKPSSPVQKKQKPQQKQSKKVEKTKAQKKKKAEPKKQINKKKNQDTDSNEDEENKEDIDNNNNSSQNEEEEKKQESNNDNLQREDFIYTEQLKEGIHDMDEFYNFKERYLGREGQFSGFKVLIGDFYTQYFKYHNDNMQINAGEELDKRGFQYDIEENFDQFVDKMMDYDIVWIICSHVTRTQEQQAKFLATMDKFLKAKKGLYLWSDNDPFYVEANLVLQKFFGGMRLNGNYSGQQIIKKGKAAKSQFDQEHSIFYGINNLYEGHTICHPENTHKDFSTLAYSTNNEDLIFIAEANDNHGRIMIDCGFTKLFDRFWNLTAGTKQYVSNSNVWLTGIPM